MTGPFQNIIHKTDQQTHHSQSHNKSFQSYHHLTRTDYTPDLAETDEEFLFANLLIRRML